jgi:hypothetical protein
MILVFGVVVKLTVKRNISQAMKLPLPFFGDSRKIPGFIPPARDAGFSGLIQRKQKQW